VRDNLRGAYHIAVKDIATYYFKPPNISWGILFPFALILAFYLRSPGNIVELVPGLLALTALFGATSMEAVVITFERRIGTLERLLLAPVSISAVLAGKIAAGAAFGFATALMVFVIAVPALSLAVPHPVFLVAGLAVQSLTYATMGAMVAVSVKEVFEAQTLANFLRFPMVFLGGVFYPVAAMPPVLQYVAQALPLTYGVNMMRAALGEGVSPSAVYLWVQLLTLAGFGLVLYLLSSSIMARQLR